LGRIRIAGTRSTSTSMPEQHTSKDRKQHLYLVSDDWNSGYSIRKVSLSRRSGKRSEQPLSSDSDEDSEQPSSSGSGKGAKPLPVFMRVSAQCGFPKFFTSAFAPRSWRCFQARLVISWASQLSTSRIGPSPMRWAAVGLGLSAPTWINTFFMTLLILCLHCCCLHDTLRYICSTISSFLETLC
jgi:hypothetical protein